jgi:hypothetical protein
MLLILGSAFYKVRVILLCSRKTFIYFFLPTLFCIHKFEFINTFKNQFLLSDVMKTHLFVLELLHADGQTWPAEQTIFWNFLLRTNYELIKSTNL